MTEEQQLRRHLRAMAAVNRQLQAQLAEVTASALPGAPLRAPGAGRSPLRRRSLGSAQWAWRRVSPLLPPATAEAVRQRAKARLVPARRPPTTGSPASRPQARPRPVRSAQTGGRLTDREALAADWLDQLEPATGTSKLSLARRPDGVVFLIEDDQQRQVKSGLLGAALEEELGFPRDATNEELEALGEAPPVEVLIAPTGPPFVVMGGLARPIRGLPVPYPADAAQAERYEKGRRLDVARANTSRMRAERTASTVGRIEARMPRPVVGAGRRAMRVVRRLANLARS